MSDSKETFVALNLNNFRLDLNNFRLGDRVYDTRRKEHGIAITHIDGALTVRGEHSKEDRVGWIGEFSLPIASYVPTFTRKHESAPETGNKVITRADLTIVMITTSRRPSYFAQTVTKLFLSDGARQNAPVFDINNLGAQFHSFKGTDHNPAANMARALSFAARQTSEWVLFLEDDLLFCDRFIDSVAAWLNEHTTMAPFQVLQSPVYLFGSATVNERNHGLYSTPWSILDSSWAPVPLEGFYGTQAFAIRRGDAADLATYLELMAGDFDPGKYDLEMVKWCRIRRPSVTHFVASIPSFVQHIGEESSIRPGEKSFTFPSFPGEGWSYVKTAIDESVPNPPDRIVAVDPGPGTVERANKLIDETLEPRMCRHGFLRCFTCETKSVDDDSRNAPRIPVICTRCGKDITPGQPSEPSPVEGHPRRGWVHYPECPQNAKDLEPRIRAAETDNDKHDECGRESSKISPIFPVPVCTICGKSISPTDTFVGDGGPSGSKEGNRFAHYECFNGREKATVTTATDSNDIVTPDGDEYEDDTILGGWPERAEEYVKTHRIEPADSSSFGDLAGDEYNIGHSINPPLEFTTSRRVKLSDYHSDWLRAIATEMDEPLKVHRKIWEYCAIAKVYLERVDPTFSDTGRLMYQRNILEDLKRDLHSPVRRPRVLGFGIGHDPLPAWFAMRGAEVVATDKPESDTIETWKLTGQHASGKDQLRRLKSVTDEEWARIDYEPCDMNAIDTHYVIDAHWESGGLIYDQPGFDLTFSCGSFEHIGGIQSSLDFFVRQMACLRPGGIAVHTTEYSINHTLHDSENLCLLRSRDIAILSSRLAEQGDLLLPFDPTPGMSQADCYIDRPPYAGNISTPCESALPEGLRLGDVGPWHLNLALDSGHVTTSIVLIAIRGGMATRQLTLEEKRQTKLERYVDNSTRGVAYRRYKNAGKPSVLFLGDAVVSSGFAKSTHGVCDHLYINGCNVRVIGMNYYGAEPPPGQETLRLCNYPIHPAFEPLHGPASADGATLLPRLIYDYSPDIVVIQNDSWNIPSYLSAIDQYFLGRGRSIPLIVGFIAVDGENQPAEPLNRLAAVITWTEYGMDQLRCGGYYGPGYVAPLAVDTSVFHPLDRDSIRASFVSSLASMSGTLAPDIDPSTVFIVGFIGRNQPRKRLDLLLQSYSLWVHGSRVTNTLLFLHVGPTGDSGFDLPSLVRYYDLLGRVIINTPEIGQGESESDLVARYNLFDVFLSCTQGEGFWFPGFEAAACGIPIIAPDHSAITEFFSSCSLLIPPSFSLASAPHNGAMRTLGGLVDPKAVAAALDTLYLSKDERARLAENGLDMVKKFTWKNTGKKFEAALRRILGVG